MRRTSLILAAGASLACCQPATVQIAPAPAPGPSSDLAQLDADGVPLLVNATCRGCHAVTKDAISPLPRAPGFVDIANTPGLTGQTLVAFLGDAHNYPDQMDVDLDEADIALIADYMLTLQSRDYTRSPS